MRKSDFDCHRRKTSVPAMITKIIGKKKLPPGTGAPAGRAVGIRLGVKVEAGVNLVANRAVAARGSEVDMGMVGMVFVGVSVTNSRSGKKLFRYAIKSPYRR